MEFCEKLKKPLIWGIPAGHTAENLTLKLGLDIIFDGYTLKQN
jgi:muramoyltetrapeptide carboxypeptidase LdcA involved in peptidoglycan recycling